MNIFIIPSWYPSTDAPFSGIFTLEQAVAFSIEYPKSNIGMSLWGQKDEKSLLWIKDHVKNIIKMLNHVKQQRSEVKRKDNFWEFYTPALTWTDKVLHGNIKNIVRANEKNLLRFSALVGKVSVIHCHVSFPAGYIGMQLADKYKIPYLITEHMSPFPFPSYMKGKKILPKIKTPILKARTVISVSPYAAADIREKTGIQPVIIPNLVDENLFTPAKELPPSPFFTFFTLGRMTSQKGFPDLLYAIKILNNHNVKFRIAGEGQLKEDYKQLSKKLNISSQIEWLGKLSRKEAAKEFQKCQAFVLSSIHESMGVVYAEAIACGKPIIATRCGGPEFMVNTENGLLVDKNSPEQLAHAINTLINNYKKYNPDTIRKDFMEQFSSKVITERLYSLYEATVSQE